MWIFVHLEEILLYLVILFSNHLVLDFGLLMDSPGKMDQPGQEPFHSCSGKCFLSSIELSLASM